MTGTLCCTLAMRRQCHLVGITSTKAARTCTNFKKLTRPQLELELSRLTCATMSSNIGSSTRLKKLMQGQTSQAKDGKRLNDALELLKEAKKQEKKKKEAERKRTYPFPFFS